ncbi:MAG: hypothetical protein O2800_03510 [Planctomycetota bacterium]|nr:hypothetical protein [Planctomycetota bacterium]
MSNQFRILGCAVVFAAALFIGRIAHGQHIKLLGSHALDARLVAAGFDEAQRGLVLDEFAQSIESFKTAANGPIAMWFIQCEVRHPTKELALEAVKSGRVAAQAWGDAESGLSTLIIATARADQKSAADAVVKWMQVRRDLAILPTSGFHFYREGHFDARDAATDLSLDAATTAAIAPALEAYSIEHASLARSYRDAVIERPLRVFEAGELFPEPILGEEEDNDGEVDPSAADGGDDDFFSRRVRSAKQRRAHSNSERTEARLRLIVLDIRTLESLFPSLTSHQKALIASDWWEQLRLGDITRQQFTMGQRWKSTGNKSSSDTAEINDLCEAWLTEFWPLAKRLASDRKEIDADRFGQMPQFEETSTANSSESVWAQLAEANQSTSDGLREQSPETRGIASKLLQSLTSVFATEEPVSISIVVGPDGFVGDENMVFESSEMIIVSDDGQVTMTRDLGSPGILPKSITMNDLRTTLESSEVPESLMVVAETVLDDLHTASKEITDAAALHDEQPLALMHAMSMGPDGQVKVLDPSERNQLAADRQSLRDRLLTLESQALLQLASATVPTDNEPSVTWLVPWRIYESARASSSTGPRTNSTPSTLNAVRFIDDAELSTDDLRIVGPNLATALATLTTFTRSAQTAQASVGQADLAFHQEFSSGRNDQARIQAAQESIRSARQSVAHANARLADALTSVESVLTSQLGDASAQRVRDALINQRYAGVLRDHTNLSTRFDAALRGDLTESTRASVVALAHSWKSASRAMRDKIVQNELSVTTGDEMAAENTRRQRCDSLQFERDELNRRVDRALRALIGVDGSKKITPLPEW